MKTLIINSNGCDDFVLNGKYFLCASAALHFMGKGLDINSPAVTPDVKFELTFGNRAFKDSKGITFKCLKAVANFDFSASWSCPAWTRHSKKIGKLENDEDYIYQTLRKELDELFPEAKVGSLHKVYFKIQRVAGSLAL